MQIKDLSTKVERLDTVRGGGFNIEVNQNGAYVDAYQDLEIADDYSQASLTHSPINQSQFVDARTKNKLHMPISVTKTRSRSFVADNGANVNFGFGGWGW